MDRASFATHSETYKIDGSYYKVAVDFIRRTVTIKSETFYRIVALDRYADFIGDMESYIKYLLKGGDDE